MKPNEIEKGGFYVMKQTELIRHFYDLTASGRVFFHVYDPYDGKLLRVGYCDLGDLSYYAERTATPEEIGKLKLWKVDEPYTGRGMALREALRTSTTKRY